MFALAHSLIPFCLFLFAGFTLNAAANFTIRYYCPGSCPSRSYDMKGLSPATIALIAVGESARLRVVWSVFEFLSLR